MKLLCQMNIFDENLDDLIDDNGNIIGTIKNTESGVFLEIKGILKKGHEVRNAHRGFRNG